MSCDSCGGYSKNFEEAVFSENERFTSNGINYSSSGYNAASASNRRGNNSRCGCDLYWRGFMAGFYSNNSCSQSAVTRTAAQAAERTTATTSRCSCCCQCNNWNCRQFCHNPVCVDDSDPWGFGYTGALGIGGS